MERDPPARFGDEQQEAQGKPCIDGTARGSRICCSSMPRTKALHQGSSSCAVGDPSSAGCGAGSVPKVLPEVPAAPL